MPYSIRPYKLGGIWVFDDERTGLVMEPFLRGSSEILDVLVREIPKAENGFTLRFCDQPFDGWTDRLDYVKDEKAQNGTWSLYRLEGRDMEGWLCPNLFRFFAKAPGHLYVKAESSP